MSKNTQLSKGKRSEMAVWKDTEVSLDCTPVVFIDTNQSYDEITIVYFCFSLVLDFSDKIQLLFHKRFFL